MSIEALNELTIVTLEAPYDNWENPTTRDLFSKMVGLKLKGYGKEYPYGVLPVDGTDFVATHNLICRKSGGSLEPVMGYKNVSLARCTAHRIPFSPLVVLRGSGAIEHEKIALEIIDRCASKGIGLSYGSSWTIDPAIRKDRELTTVLKEMMTAMLVLHCTEIGSTEQIGCGSVRFKTDKYFQDLGYVLFKKGFQTLPSFQQATLIGDEAVVMHCKTFSKYALEIADKYRSWWDSRLVIGVDRVLQGTTQTEKLAA